MPSRRHHRTRGIFTASALVLATMWLWQDLVHAPYELMIEGGNRFAGDKGTSQVSLRTRHPVRRWLNASSLMRPETYEVIFDPKAIQRLGVQVWLTKSGSWLVRAGAHAGRLPISLWQYDADGKRLVAERAITFRHNDADRDADGLPDLIEMRTEDERSSFTSWFTTIAEAQATRIDDRWPPIHQDCAGLVRFAFREALRRHDQQWLSKWRYLPKMPETRDPIYVYPNLPIVEDTPFRSVSGPYDPARPRQAQFSAAPNARTLWQHNTEFISKDVSQARAGDLLFFHLPDGLGSRLHTMVALGETPAATHHARGTRVVYHTGLPAPQGEVRLVTLRKLHEHPDPSWHPVVSNPRFLGIHRLSHLVFESQTQPRFAWDSRQRSAP